MKNCISMNKYKYLLINLNKLKKYSNNNILMIQAFFLS